MTKRLLKYVRQQKAQEEKQNCNRFVQIYCVKVKCSLKRLLVLLFQFDFYAVMCSPYFSKILNCMGLIFQSPNKLIVFFKNFIFSAFFIAICSSFYSESMTYAQAESCLEKSLSHIQSLEAAWFSEWLQSDDVKLPLHYSCVQSIVWLLKCLFNSKSWSIDFCQTIKWISCHCYLGRVFYYFDDRKTT